MWLLMCSPPSTPPSRKRLLGCRTTHFSTISQSSDIYFSRSPRTVVAQYCSLIKTSGAHLLWRSVLSPANFHSIFIDIVSFRRERRGTKFVYIWRFISPISPGLHICPHTPPAYRGQARDTSTQGNTKGVFVSSSTWLKTAKNCQTLQEKLWIGII